MKTKKWRKIISVLLSMTVVITMLPTLLVGVSAASAPFSFTDDFSYDQAGGTNLSGQTFGQNWQNSAQSNGLGYMSSAVATDPDNAANKVMGIYGGGDALSGVDLAVSTAGISSAKIVQVDIRGAGYNNNYKYGLNVMTKTGSDELSDRYQLLVNGGTCSFVKMVNYNGSVSQSSSTAMTNMNTWYTFRLILNGSNISWSITQKGGDYSWTGSYTDPSPLAASSVQLYMSGQWNPPAFFDNFAIRDYDSFLDGGVEPDNVMYQNVACSKHVVTPANSPAGISNANDGNAATVYTATTGAPYAIDLGAAYIPRRLQLFGLTNSGGALDIKASNDANTWTTITNTGTTGSSGTEDWNWVNTVSANSYRYIRIERQSGSESYGFGEIKVLSAVDLSATLKLPIDAFIYLLPRINGADAFTGATWTTTNSSVARVNNGMVSPIYYGSTAITSTVGLNSLTVNVSVGGNGCFIDDFNYNLAGGTNIDGQTFGQNWQNSAQSNGLGYMSSAVATDPDNAANKVMGIYGGGDTLSGVDLAVSTAGISSAKIVQVDIRGAGYNNNYKYGINVMTKTGSNELSDRYQLAVDGGTCSFAKIVNYNGEASQSSPTAMTNMNTWYTFKLILNGSDVSWSITQKGGGYSWTGSYTDPSSLATSSVQLYMSGQWNPPAYFDNFTFKSYDAYMVSGAEPNSVMYQNVACDKAVILPSSTVTGIENANDGNTSASYTSAGGAAYAVDLGAAYPIRRVQILGLSNTNEPIDIMVSNDAATWLTLTNTGTIGNGGAADWNWVNVTTPQQYRFIKIAPQSGSNSYSFTELRVLTDVDNSTLNVKLNSGLYLFPRITGADAFTGTSWTNSQQGFVSVNNGTILQPISRTTSGPVTVTGTKNGNSVSTNVNVTDAYSVVNSNDNFTVSLGAKVTKTDPTAIVAFYDSSNNLIRCEIVNISLINKNVDEVTFNATKYTANSTKVFLWDGGIVSLKPLIPACIIN